MKSVRAAWKHRKRSRTNESKQSHRERWNRPLLEFGTEEQTNSSGQAQTLKQFRLLALRVQGHCRLKRKTTERILNWRARTTASVPPPLKNKEFKKKKREREIIYSRYGSSCSVCVYLLVFAGVAVVRADSCPRRHGEQHFYAALCPKERSGEPADVRQERR